MSHASAQFHFVDGATLHGEYDGTSDIMLPWMYPTEEERSANWRRVGDWPSCDCKPEPCIAHSDYGGGFCWLGEACRVHMIFVGPQSHYTDEYDEFDDREAHDAYQAVGGVRL